MRCASRAGSRERTGQSVAAAPESEARLCGYLSQRHDLHEDYSDSTLRGMTPFYRALDELAAKPRPVRIAYFGDSFIEADILTADRVRCCRSVMAAAG